MSSAESWKEKGVKFEVGKCKKVYKTMKRLRTHIQEKHPGMLGLVDGVDRWDKEEPVTSTQSLVATMETDSKAAA